MIMKRTLIGAIPMVTVAESAVNWRNTHTHMDRTHSLTHLQQHGYKQPRGAKRELGYYFSVHAGSFLVSETQRTLTWTTGSLTCVCDRSYACVYTRGLGTQTAS